MLNQTYGSATVIGTGTQMGVQFEVDLEGEGSHLFRGLHILETTSNDHRKRTAGFRRRRSSF